ncbi:RNA-directed DNA polymerase, eukaryota, reverse transcriptase zinc-binding domain protein [Tanacetum coccineum]|uniref:RNA-directed DNA polymerase, eukaryota, reverse transcriptase zinc-binding domain protein n=1 Tax=Tanacetum coccineum TaxID=301880 RepID=A0ABQ5HEG0_9ASTR
MLKGLFDDGSDKEEVDSVIENRGSKKNDDSGSKDKNEEVIDECLSAHRSNGDGSDGKDGKNAELMEDKMNNGIDEITEFLSNSEDPALIPVVDVSNQPQDEFTKYCNDFFEIDANSSDKMENVNLNTYASKLNANVNNDENKMFFVPTCTNNKGDEVVRFKEELVREECEKWKYIVCGYLVGCRMFVNELKYNIRRMWGRLGLKDIVVDVEKMSFFKFRSDEQMNYVLDQSPWLYNVPLEAWSIKGISTISSRLGLPVRMDHMTAEMCKEGTNRLGYARVLVEIDAGKNYVDKVKIYYADSQINVKKTKWVKVEYSWKPGRCNHCGVFGHSFNNYKSKPKIVVEAKKGINKQEKGGNNAEGFVEVRNIRNRVGNYGPRSNQVGKTLRSDQREETSATATETMNWIYDMVNYFKYQWEAIVIKDKMGNVDSEEEDVYENQHEVIHGITTNERIVNNHPWILMGDFNVTIKLDEKSTGASNMTSEMDEFRSVTQISEVDDICSSVLVIPDGLPRKKKSFRFVNYVADKIDFLDVVQ